MGNDGGVALGGVEGVDDRLGGESGTIRVGQGRGRTGVPYRCRLTWCGEQIVQLWRLDASSAVAVT
jgi:hypothetical protein